jgi:hypothetical protein
MAGYAIPLPLEPDKRDEIVARLAALEEQFPGITVFDALLVDCEGKEALSTMQKLIDEIAGGQKK